MCKKLKGVFFWLLTSAFVVSFSCVYGQETKTTIYIEGMIGATLGDGFATINIGGPSLSVVIKEGFKVGVGALPSLHLEVGKATPKLGLGPRIDLKKVSIIAPFFPVQPTGKWAGSLGLAYKFGRKK